MGWSYLPIAISPGCIQPEFPHANHSVSISPLLAWWGTIPPAFHSRASTISPHCFSRFSFRKITREYSLGNNQKRTCRRDIRSKLVRIMDIAALGVSHEATFRLRLEEEGRFHPPLYQGCVHSALAWLPTPAFHSALPGRTCVCSSPHPHSRFSGYRPE